MAPRLLPVRCMQTRLFVLAASLVIAQGAHAERLSLLDVASPVEGPPARAASWRVASQGAAVAPKAGAYRFDPALHTPGFKNDLAVDESKAEPGSQLNRG